MVNKILLELEDKENSFHFDATIVSELIGTRTEIKKIEDSVDSIKNLKPECDKVDYLLAASSGALCGIIDIFLVGKPGDSYLGDMTDKWFENKTQEFAEVMGCPEAENKSMSEIIRWLEKKFGVQYDQRGAGDSGSVIFDLTPSNHHFKSLGHNPSLLGAFFSILDQFTNQSHFVSNGKLISLQNVSGGKTLVGSNVISKIFSGLVNWFGHLMSDLNGSSGSKGRGMGIPSPLWTWTNDVIAIKSKLNIPVSEFDKNINELAMALFNKGYDIRFQTAQMIPVVINEMVVRFLYCVRRLLRYYANVEKSNRSFSLMWSECEPFSNPTVKRMLTTAHGTFCLIDVGDATVRGVVAGGGSIDLSEFFLRLNIIGVGRFTISLYGEAKRGIQIHKNIQLEKSLIRKKEIINSYIEGLEELSQMYDDNHLIIMISDFSNSQMYKETFFASIELAEKRKIPRNKILLTKEDGDNYFRSGKNDKKRN